MPDSLEGLRAHRGEAEAVLQEKLEPLPERHQRLYSVQQVVLLDHLPRHVGGDAAEVTPTFTTRCSSQIACSTSLGST